MNQNNEKESESNLFFFLRLFISNWKSLMIVYLLIAVTTAIILLVIPKWYKSEATVVILEENSSSLSNVMSEFSALGIGLGGGGSVETFIGYLNTQKMYNRLIAEFNLEEVYETEIREELHEAIFANLGVVDNENKTFTISYLYEEDPEKPKEIVQFLYEELDKIALEVDKAEASNFRRYIEDYYKEVQNKLRADEDSLTRFQNNTGLLDLETQLAVTVSGIAELEKQIISLEIEKNYLNNTFQNPSRLQEIDSRIKAIKDKLSELSKTQNNTLLPLDLLPKQGADFLRLKRDVLVGEKVSEFLRLQYEQALLDEQKINSNLYLVDPPNVPQKRFKPQRTKVFVIVMFFTFIISLIYIRTKEYYENNKDALLGLLDH